jgi:metacaspase-1
MSKRALLVGLNTYPNPENALRGCLNDVRQMAALLRTRFGFVDRTAVLTLTDSAATTAAIKKALSWLVAGARPGDVMVFHYSGHGSQVPDVHGDEHGDGLDEIICPYDLDWEHPFTDDELHGIVGGVPHGARLTVVLDCCHAGTGLREPRRERVKCLPRPSAGASSGGTRMAASVRRFGSRAARDGAILVAACREDQVSADAFIDGDYHGALTYALCRTIEDRDHPMTYGDLMRGVRASLRAGGFEQDPQLEGPAGAARAMVFSAPEARAVLSPA